jgi:hypothetical protein
LNWSGDIEANPQSGTEGDRATFDIPTEFRLGASGVLTPRLSLSLGLSFADWKSSGQFLDDGDVVGQVWSYGGGVEWAGPRMGSRNFPLRVGFKSTDLPFAFEGETPRETLFSGGIGLNLVPSGAGFIGVVDIALERGKREAGSLSETFSRASLTFRVGSF